MLWTVLALISGLALLVFTGYTGYLISTVIS